MRILFRILGASVAIFFTILFVTLTFSFIRKVWFGGSGTAGKDHVAVISVEGLLISSDTTLDELEAIEENDRAKALVVRVNSPGGLVAPSQEIFEALKKTNERIPVVISMGPLAASGGYYVSLGGRTIFASPGTLTASIGVIIEMANTQKLYEWAKVERFSLSAGKFKEVGTPNRAMRPDEKELLMTLIHEIHGQFRAAVAERRGLTPAELENTADGRVMTGTQALKAKLVDVLGGFPAALAEAKNLGGLDKDAPHRSYTEEQSPFRKYILGEASTPLESLISQFVLGVPREGLIVPGWKVLLVSRIR